MRNQWRAMLRPSYEESGSGGEISVEVSAEVAAADELATITVESQADIEATVKESEEGAAQAELVESVAEIVAEEGYTKGVARLVEALGITDFAAYSRGIQIAGHESLSLQSKNEREAYRVVVACEGMLRDFGNKIMKFLRTIWEKIQALFSWIKQKFTNYKKTIAELVRKLEKGTISSEKAKDKKYHKPKEEGSDMLKWLEKATKAYDEVKKIDINNTDAFMVDSPDDKHRSPSAFVASIVAGAIGETYDKDKTTSDYFKDFSIKIDTEDTNINNEEKRFVIDGLKYAARVLTDVENLKVEADAKTQLALAESEIKHMEDMERQSVKIADSKTEVDGTGNIIELPEQVKKLKELRMGLEILRAKSSAMTFMVSLISKAVNRGAQMVISAGNAFVACLE